MTPSAEAIKQSFDFAADNVKQLISLSTGIIALTITFSKDLVGSVSKRGVRLLRTSWTLYLVSMIAGVLALGAMTGTLAKEDRPDIYKPGIVLMASLQWLLFLAGTGILLTYAGQMLQSRSRAHKPEIAGSKPTQETAP